jgi:hypothetical protein
MGRPITFQKMNYLLLKHLDRKRTPEMLMAGHTNRTVDDDAKSLRWLILLLLGLGPFLVGCNQRYVPADYRARLERSSEARKMGMRNPLDTMPAGNSLPAGNTLPGGQTLPRGNSLPSRSTLPTGVRLPGGSTLPARGALPSGSQPSTDRSGGSTLPRDSRLPAN